LADNTAGVNSSRGFTGALRAELRRWLPWLLIALLGLGPLFLCALVGPTEMGSSLGQKAAPDWSRAMPVGSDFYGTDSGAPLVVDQSRRVHLVWTVRHSAQDSELRYLRLDEEGMAEEEHDLNVSLFQPRKLRLVLGKNARIHAFLLASSVQGDYSNLYHLVLTADGHLDSGPDLLSSGLNHCFEYDVAATSSGTIHAVWTEGAGAERDLYYSTPSLGLGASTAPRVVARGVAHPVAAIGPNDALHLLWEEPGHDEDTAELYLAVVTDEMPESVSGLKLLDLPTGSRFFRTGPILTFDQLHAYLVWTVEYRRDMTAPAISEGWYASFALDSPSKVSARTLYLPVEEKPDYVAYDSPLRFEYLVPSTGDEEYGSERLTYPSALAGHQEAVVTCGMTMSRGVSPEHQIVNLVFRDGGLLGYQVACNTTHWSRLSNVVADRDGDLHLSWVEGLEPGPSAVYYATTVQQIRQRVDGLTRDDFLFAVLNTAFSAVAGVAAIPFAILWILPSLVWALIAGRFLGNRIQGAAGYGAFAVTVCIYQASKLYFSPSLLDYVPFSVSIPFLSARLYAAMRVVVPVGILAASTVAALYAMIRAESRSLLAVSLVFILIDAFLTLMIYGPGLALGG